MKKTIFLGLFLLLGCSQFKGSKGDKGDPGPGNIFLYQGALNSNDQTIFCTQLKSNSIIDVYVQATSGGSTTTFQIPIYAAGIATNVYYQYNGGTSIEVFNTQTIGGYWYKVYIINGAQPQNVSGLSKLFP
jgi:hypothetical protein